MPELKEVFEMVTNQTEPDLDSWKHQDERQRRTARNRKLGVFALAAAIAVVVGVMVLRADDAADRTTVGNDMAPSPQQVAASFAEAYGSFDADAAIAFLAEDADISGLLLGPTDVQGLEPALRLNVSMLDASKFMQLSGTCEVIRTEGSASIVQCPFDFFIAGSDYQGQGNAAPVTGAFYELWVDAGEITHASVDWGGNLASMWEGFADWVSRKHPGDIPLMFADDSHAEIRLSEESVRLWRLNLYRILEAPTSFCPTFPNC